jgi:hypothetical protein
VPSYKGVLCRGACERKGFSCPMMELFAEPAAAYGAEPQERMSLDGPYNVLFIPRGQPGYNVAVTGALREINRNPAYRNVPLGHLLAEAPCHLVCGITVCHICGKQHAIVEGHGRDYCPYQTNEDMTEASEHDRAWGRVNKRGAPV